MLRTRDLPIGFITKRSTAPVAHEAKRDSRQEAKRAISAPKSKTPLVPATRPEPSFHRYLDLPPALLALVAIFWNQKDLHQFNCALVGLYNHCFRTLPLAASGDGAAVVTYRPMEAFLHRQFKVIPRTVRLLHAVIGADYSQAQAAVDQDPSLMFEPVHSRYCDENSEYISPLKYAFKVYDTYMWKLFYEKIKKNSEQVKEFLKQAQEQTKHIDLAPLFTAYEEYQKQHQLWFAKKITDKELDAAWVKLGAAQQLILPVHMLKEFSRKGNTWGAKSAFDVTAMPPPPGNCLIYDFLKETWRTLPSIISDRGWGLSFSLIRAGESTARVMERQRLSGMHRFDLESLRRLLEVREKDLTKQISLLSQNVNTIHNDNSDQFAPLAFVFRG